MNMNNSLFPGYCLEGFYGHYTAAAEDSTALLASLFSVSEEDLLRANPHITSTGNLQAGTKIHIPGLIPFPAGILFGLADKELSFANGGGAFIHLSPEGGQSVSVIVTLPASSYFGAYDLYVVEVMVTSNNIFEGQLFATPDDPPCWAARVDLPFLTSLSPESRILIRPFNSLSGEAGEIILAIDFSNLPATDCTAANAEALSITSEDLPPEDEIKDNPAALLDEVSGEENGTLNEEAEVFDDIAVITEKPSEELPASEDLPMTEVMAENTDQSAAEESDSLPEDPPVMDESTADNVLPLEEQASDMKVLDPLEEVPSAEEENDSEPEVTDDAAEGSSAEAIASAEDLAGDLEAAATHQEVPLAEENEPSAGAVIDEVPEESSAPEEDNGQLQLTETMAVEEKLETEPIIQENFQAEQILARLDGDKKLSPRFKPSYYMNKNRKPINLLLTPTADAEHAIGIASVQLQPSQIIISAIKLPEPSSLGPQYKYYKAWLVDAGNNKTAVLEMKKILNGVWAGRSSNTALKAFDLVLITAEVSPNVAKPAGPEVLIGILSD
ncbi:MAG TPA: LysM peptidoglycan-binding domain-containing protein [Syntrophomonadaceae bacterium]|nr:LysM peptidoglycan-binding domain-containing protein [Syntrophomonadaceae bacterium]